MKAVLWDIDGTLLSFEKAEKHAIGQAFEEFELGALRDGMMADYSKINRSYWERLERKEITKREVLIGRFIEFFGKYNLDITKAEAFNDRYQILLGTFVFFNDGGLETVEKLKEMGIVQLAVTNGTKTAQSLKLAKSGLDQLLDGIFISEDIGVEKPDVKFFEPVFERLAGMERDEMVIVGDSLTSDMKGGENAGIRTCWFNPGKKENSTGVRIDWEIRELSEVLGLI